MTMYSSMLYQRKSVKANAGYFCWANYCAYNDEGKYNFDFVTANGISVSESGAPVGEDGTPLLTALPSTLSSADEKGFQPQSDLLPVAPEFPHPISQFVLDQIAFAAAEDAARAHGELWDANRPSNRYGAP
ncbi:cuticle protein AMP1A-like [Penaeus chinensis]|uniref:cuticle protein AMP1A-like n=1 Tax=Penaeus chinensis TaxID=139456 RepID=UPI001FB7FFB2|nr:cuticle protein AMP1A-like [Penaeus chinensis]